MLKGQIYCLWNHALGDTNRCSRYIFTNVDQPLKLQENMENLGVETTCFLDMEHILEIFPQAVAPAITKEMMLRSMFHAEGSILIGLYHT